MALSSLVGIADVSSVPLLLPRYTSYSHDCAVTNFLISFFKNIQILPLKLAVLFLFDIDHYVKQEKNNTIILIEENISLNADAGNQQGLVFYALVVAVDGFECRMYFPCWGPL